MALTVGSALHWWGRVTGDRPAIRFEDDLVDYRTLDHWTSRVARMLADLGVERGDRIGVLGPNSVEWPVAALSVSKAGAVIVPLNSRFTAAEVGKVAAEAGARLVLADSSCIALAESVIAGTATRVVAFDTLAERRVGEADEYRVDAEPDELLAVMFTSGSTGEPKGVVYTNRMLMDICFEASLREDGIHPGYSMLMTLPLNFLPGLLNGVLMPVTFGGTTIIEPTFVPERAVRAIEEHAVDMVCGVPLVFQSMADTPEFASADLSSLKTAIVGGAAVPGPLLRSWADKGVSLRQIYGMTESGGVSTATLPAEAFEHPDTCGVGSVFSEFTVVRADGDRCGPGEPGEILLRGPGVTPGYWGDDATTAAAFAGGWLHTGDLGAVDDGGRLRFLDRLKDLIISGGINISPIELERVIQGVAGVEEVAVIAVPDERFGETPAAIVTGSVVVADVLDRCRRELADYKIPRYVVVLDEPLPRLPSGKLAKARIRREYRDIPDRCARVR